MKRKSKLVSKNLKTTNEKRERITVTIMAGILLSLLYVLIFGFSAQDGKESGNLSREVTEKCVDTVTELSGKKVNASEKRRLVEKFEKPVRKLAHFTEYAIMGLLVFVILAQWYEKSRARFWYNTGWVFVSAAFDELHQSFIPGRWPTIWDVFLDTAGGMAGIGVAVAVWGLFLKVNGISLRRKDI